MERHPDLDEAVHDHFARAPAIRHARFINMTPRQICHLLVHAVNRLYLEFISRRF